MVNHRRPRSGHNGRFVPSMDTAERLAKVAEMRAQDKSFTEIAAALGYSDRHNARRAFQSLLAATVAKPAEDARNLELAKLDLAEAAVWDVLEREHITVSNGKVIYTQGPEAKPLLDDDPVLRAVAQLLNIQARRAKLLGLDAPAQLEAQVTNVTPADEAFADTVTTAKERRAQARRLLAEAIAAEEADDPEVTPT